jgi:hypothetical protein
LEHEVAYLLNQYPINGNEQGVGGTVWSDEANIVAQNGQAASSLMTLSADLTNYLVASFDMAIPNKEVIGVGLSARARIPTLEQGGELLLLVSVDGGSSWSDPKTVIQGIDSSWQTDEVGGVGELWGQEFIDPASLFALGGDFLVAVQGRRFLSIPLEDTTIEVDAVWANVYWREAVYVAGSERARSTFGTRLSDGGTVGSVRSILFG